MRSLVQCYGFTGIGPVLTPYLENAVVYADENENSGVKKVFTADQLKVAWGDADYELADGQWKLSFAKQYNQVKWTLPESIEMSQVNAVTFQVADQKVPISLKVYNGGDDATAANTQYGLSGQTEYTINPSGDGAIDAVGIMITEDKPENATVSLVSVTFELKAGAGDAKLGDNIIKNGDFAASEAAESWNSAAGESVVSVAAEEEEIADSGLKTYGVLTRNQETATPGDCFSQDITDAVEKGKHTNSHSGQNCPMITKILRKSREMWSLHHSMFPVVRQHILEVIQQVFCQETVQRH